MTSPLRIGASLPEREWRSLRLRTIFEDCKWDPQCSDRPVLARYPIVIQANEWKRLCGLAEQLAREALQAEDELEHRPDLIRELGLPRPVRRCFARNGEAPSAQAARVMRFDFHFITNGWRISEVNCDVPGGFIEAGGFTEKMARHISGVGIPPNPGRVYSEAIRRAVGDGARVALIHATAHSDDRQVMEYLSRILSRAGVRAVLLSPSHLRWEAGCARISCCFAEGCPDLLVRFFPGEWLPRLGDSSLWRSYFRGGRTPMSNPGNAILVQSKRFPLVWDRFKTPLPTWRALLPETRCPSDVRDLGSGAWVLKPALGRVGEDVGMRGVTEDRAWRRIVFGARWRPSVWAAQERFEAVALENYDGAVYPCLGVFVIDGKAAGVYGRAARKPLIDHEAQDVPVLIEGAEARLE